MRFTILVLAGQPGLHVDTASVWLANIGCTLLQNLVRQAESCKQMFLNSHEQQVLLKSILARGKAFHFQFVKLVHAKDALHVFTICTCFAAEASGVADIAKRQL
ncbi:hypothetical protein D9M68_806570 [compost metagenome]